MGRAAKENWVDLLCLGDLGDNWDRWMMSLVIKNSSSTKLINQLIQNGEIYDPNDSETYSEYQNPWGIQENKKFLVGTFGTFGFFPQ
jgi:hypothetical protein